MDNKALTPKKPMKDKTGLRFFRIKRDELLSNEKKEVENQNKVYNLEDVLKDRIMKEVSYPAIEVLEKHFLNEGRLTEETTRKIISLAQALLRKENNLLDIKPPVTIVGDIHGQYYDLLTAIDHGGVPGKTKYLFLGDYVDRGNFSMEVLLYLYSLKILYPDSVFLLRF